MFAEQFQDDEKQVRSGSELRCTFCEGEAGPQDHSAFIFGQGAGSSMGACCGVCAHRMGVTGTVDVCRFCLLPILSNPQIPPGDEEFVVCDHCIEIFKRLRLDCPTRE